MSDVAVVCSTYRDPNKDNSVREYGIMKLVEQVFSQNYDQGEITLIIVDDSPEPHPFIDKVKEKLGDKLIYHHVPSRNNISDEIKLKYPRACEFLPSDNDLETPKWKAVIAHVDAWQNFLPFDYMFARENKIDMSGQIRNDRPTIGMKKNMGCMSYVEAKGAAPKVFVFVDDDDLRSPDYISEVVSKMPERGFGRMTKTYAYNYSGEEKGRIWGEIDFQVESDVNGNWFIPNDVMESPCFKVAEGGNIIERPVHDLYQRNLLLAWPLISHDGALHNYTGDVWLEAAEKFGGFFPTSFSEDIITHKRMKEKLDIETRRIDVEEAHFIRCADGRNASDFYATKVLDAETDVASWAKDAIEGFYKYVDLKPEQREDYMRKVAKLYIVGEKIIDAAPFSHKQEEIQDAIARAPRLTRYTCG